MGAQESNPFYATSANGKWFKPFNDNVSIEVFKSNYNAILGLSEENTLEVKEVLSDDLGMEHTKYQQLYKGVPVEGAIVILHEKNGKVVSFNGSFVKGIYLNTTTGISSEKSIAKALEVMPAKRYYWEIPEMEDFIKKKERNENATFYPSPELVIAKESFDQDSKGYKLSYRLDVYAEGEHNHKTLFIDAQTGSLNFELERCHEGQSNGTANTRYSGTQNIVTDSIAADVYHLQDDSRGGGIHVVNANNSDSLQNAIEFVDSNNVWDNANAQMNDAATDAFWGLEMTYDYFLQKHNRDSYDNNAGAILAYVHVGNGWFNATWNGAFIQFGDGNGNPLTAIDVAGHELSHGVTEYSAGLIYSYESGALNESFSDIFGNSVEFFAQDPNASWLVGKANYILRDMADPNAFGQPDTYKGTGWEFGSVDNGGVHTNSGVQNYWYYLLAEGGVGTNDLGNNYSVSKLGLDTAGFIAYRNLAYYLTPSSNYFDARQGSIESAVDLYGSCSVPVNEVIKAWHAVGIGETTITEDFEALEGTAFNSGCDLSATEVLDMNFRYNNNGCNSTLVAGDSIALSYSLNGIVNTEYYLMSTVPQFGDSLSFTFSKTADFSTAGLYDLKYWVGFATDNFVYNDSLIGIEVINTLPLSDTANFINFEPGTPYDVQAFYINGDQGLTSRRTGVASNNSLFGLRLTSAFVDPDNIVMPTSQADNFVLNPQYGSSICACVDASNWSNVALTFDAKQTYSEMYLQLPQVGADIPEFASSLRVTVNGVQEGYQLHPVTYKSDPYYTHLLNLDKYAGTQFQVCFEGKHFIPLWDDFVQGSPGDNSYLDNIKFEDKQVISVSEEALAEFKVFPNPAEEVVYIETKNIVGNVSIVNSVGQVLLSTTINVSENRTALNTSTFDSGVYFIQIENGTELYIEKLVIL